VCREGARQIRTAASGSGGRDARIAGRHLSHGNGAAAAQGNPERPVCRGGPVDRGARRRWRVPKPEFCGARHAPRGAPVGTFHDQRGGRAVVSLTSLPTGRQGQLLALSLVLVALGGFYLLAVAPLLDLYAQRGALVENKLMLLPRLRAAAEELPQLRARLDQLRSAASSRKITLEGATDAIASANLQSRIE